LEAGQHLRANLEPPVIIVMILKLISRILSLSLHVTLCDCCAIFYRTSRSDL